MNTRASASPQKAAPARGPSATASSRQTTPSAFASRSPSRGRAPGRRTSDRQLQAFLQERVGHSWAGVTAALKEAFVPEGHSLELFLKQLDVASRTVVREGKVRVQHEVHGLLGLEDSTARFYVDPVSKELKLNEARVRKEAQERARREKLRREAQATRRDLSDTLQAHKLIGKTGYKWVVVELTELGSSGFDVMLGRNVSVSDRAELAQRYGRSGVFAHQKRELSYRECNQLKLG